MIRAATSVRLIPLRGAGRVRVAKASPLCSTSYVSQRLSERNRTNRSLSLQPRCYSTSPVIHDAAGSDSSSLSTTSSSSNPSFSDTMSKLFELPETVNTSGAGDAAFEPVWYNVADQAINTLTYFHDETGLSYGVTIVSLTCIIRVFMFPLFVRAQQNASRMAHMQPEMQTLKARMDEMGKNVDQAAQVKMGLQMRALFQKYNCNPMRALLVPIVQAPVFMGMFFGLRKMPDFYTAELASGGILWFPDLSVADPLFVLPLTSAATFLITIELGKHQMTQSNPAQGQIMVNVFRAMALAMIPIASNFSAALNLYWVTNNTITMIQSGAFQNAAVRKALGIWEPPKPVPGIPQAKGIVESIQDVIERKPSQAELIKAHNEAVENRKRVASFGNGRKTYKK